MSERARRGVLRRALHRGHRLLLVFALVAGLAMPVLPASAAAPDTTIVVSESAVAPLGANLLGGNLSPWGAYWPDSQYNAMLGDMGMNIMRVGHGEKLLVDMEAWYPTKGGTPNWKAPGVLGAGKTFDDQIAWWKSLNMPILYTLNDELSTAMLNADGSLNVNEVARAWSLHIKHLIDSGVNIRYVEIGNECDIQPMEGIEYPPVDQSRGGKPGTGRFVDVHVEPASANDYVKLWNAVYPAIKAVAPGVKISAYPSGQGVGTSPYFPFDYLFTQSPYRPDSFSFHQYSFAAATTAPQRVVDSTWEYTGKFYNDWEGQVRTVQDVLAGWGAAGTPIGISEFNYDGGGAYTTANQMWDAVFYASVIANAADNGIQHTQFWDTFAGSNTDELISDAYAGTPQMRSQALAMRLLKQFFTTGREVLSASVTSNDNAVAYDWQGTPVTAPGIAGKRVEVMATRDASGGRKALLINKNVSLAHETALTLQGVTNTTATVEVYSTRTALANQAPTKSTLNLVSGSVQLTLPPMSMAVVSVGNGSVPPPPPPADTTKPTVQITAPAAGATVSGPTTIAASAVDTGGIDRVEFRVDGAFYASDNTAPYEVNWYAPLGGSAPTGPAVAFSFDDGPAADYTDYYPVLRAAGYPGTMYVNTDFVGDGSTVSLAQLTDMRDHGWEISSHTADHWPNLPASPTAADYEASVARAKTWLDSNGFPNSGFASPGGLTNAVIRQVVSKYHPYNRTEWGTGALPIADPYAIQCSPIDYLPLTDLLATLDQVQSTKGYTVFLSHANEAPTVFSQLVSAVKQRGIEVRTVRDLLGSGPAGPHTIEAVAYDKAGNAATATVSVNGATPPPPADTTPPGPVTNLRAQANASAVNVTWTLPADADRAAVRILRSTTGYATSPTSTAVQTQVYQGLGTSYSDNTSTTVAHYYTAYVRDTAGNWSVRATALQAAYVAPDTTPPAPVTNLAALANASAVNVTWTLPADADRAAVRILRSTTGYATSPTSTAGQTQAYEGLGTAYSDNTSTTVAHYYTAYVRDTAGNWSVRATVLQAAYVAPDTTPPAPVTAFSALADASAVNLSWALPSDPDKAEVLVLRSTTGYAASPASAASQTAVYDALGTAFLDNTTTSVTNYYTAYVRDAAGNWSLPATAAAAPTGVSVIVPEPSTLTLWSTSKSIRPGRSVTLYGDLTGANGLPLQTSQVPVTIEWRPEGQLTWSILGAVNTDATGKYSLITYPIGNTVYRATWQGEAGYAAATSRSRLVQIQTRRK